MAEFITTEIHEQICHITLDRADQRNALNWQMIDELGEAIDIAERAYLDGEARVIFIKAAGRVFSSGIDLASFVQESNPFGDNWQDNLFPTTYALQSVTNKIEDCSLPTFCLMQGYCLGLGLEIALACDFRIAAERTKMALPESRLGMIPDVGGTTRLLRLVGPSRAKEIIMTGGNIDITDAERWGLINYVVPKDELLSKAEERAKEIMLSAPMAVSFTKRMINDMLDDRSNLKIEAWAQAQLLRTEDCRNGVNAMLTKTYPVEWKGK
ncbi:MAG: crotonase [Anaerolineaceae bacterium]|nr:crotonase [Anaerolineaceae bacterium]